MEWLTNLFRAFAKPFQWWVTVAPWERGLRVRLGKVAAELAPGIHLRIPFLDRIHLQSIRLRSIWDSNHTLTSRDGLPITVNLVIDYSVVSLRQLFESLSTPDTTLRYRAAAALARFASQHDRKALTVEAIEAAINEELGRFGCGLGGIRVRVAAFSFARAIRLLVNDYGGGGGLHNEFDRDPGRTI